MLTFPITWYADEPAATRALSAMNTTPAFEFSFHISHALPNVAIERRLTEATKMSFHP